VEINIFFKFFSDEATFPFAPFFLSVFPVVGATTFPRNDTQPNDTLVTTLAKLVQGVKNVNISLPIMQCVVMLSFVILNVVMVNVVILSVIILSVIVQWVLCRVYTECRCTVDFMQSVIILSVIVQWVLYRVSSLSVN
jgi:hypothetical protein